jgi:hypothetical protein
MAGASSGARRRRKGQNLLAPVDCWPTFERFKDAIVVTNKDAWLDLAHRFCEKGKAIFDQSDVLESAAGTRDPEVVALALLARTMGNFQAGILLLENATSSRQGPWRDVATRISSGPRRSGPKFGVGDSFPRSPAKARRPSRIDPADH